MVNIYNTQLIGAYVMFMLAVALFALTIRRQRGWTSVASMLMGAGSLLLSIHFFVQCVFHFHEYSTQLGALVNLVFCMMCSYFYNTSLLYLMRRGRLDWREWLFAPVAWLICLLIIMVASGGDPLLYAHPTSGMTVALRVMAGVYALTLAAYNLQQLREYWRMKRALAEYYDNTAEMMIGWMRWSMLALALGAFGVPVAVFQGSPLLPYFTLFIITVLCYVTATFCLYTVNNDAARVVAAERFAAIQEKIEEQTEAVPGSEPTEKQMNDTEAQVITDKIEAWIKTEGYLKKGISLDDVIAEVGITQQQMSRWQKATDKPKFNRWISQLRIDYAQRLLREHPDWSLDAISQYSQFSDYSNFSRAFRKEMGLSPSEWLKQNQSG